MTTILERITVGIGIAIMSGLFAEIRYMRKTLSEIQAKHEKQFTKRKIDIDEEHINRSQMTKAVNKLDKRVSENNNLLLRFLSKK